MFFFYKSWFMKFLTIYFEIIIDQQEIEKNVYQSPMHPSLHLLQRQHLIQL